MQQAHDTLATLTTGLAELRGNPAIPALPLSRDDPTFTSVSTTQQTVIQSASLEGTTTPAAAITVDATVSQPPTEDDRESPGRRTLLAGVLAVVLLAASVLVTVLISDGRVTDGNAAHPTSTLGGPAQSLQPLPTQPGPSGPTQVIPPTTPAVPSSPQNTPEQLQQVITDYYTLMPENLPAAWKRLTANYQQNHAGGFTGYQNFWNPVQRVTVFDVSTKQGGTVDATIDYFFKDGRVIEEQTSYGLLAEDGLWKIDSSMVRSSQTKQGS